MEALTVVRTALELARHRQAEVPSFPIYASCVAQLEYLLAVISHELPIDRVKLRTIIIGHYGAREFEGSDPEFADALMKSQWFASQMADGLKVE